MYIALMVMYYMPLNYYFVQENKILRMVKNILIVFFSDLEVQN